MSQITIRVSEPLHAAVRVLAHVRHKSINQTIAELLEWAVTRHRESDKVFREGVDDSDSASWSDYE